MATLLANRPTHDTTSPRLLLGRRQEVMYTVWQGRSQHLLYHLPSTFSLLLKVAISSSGSDFQLMYNWLAQLSDIFTQLSTELFDFLTKPCLASPFAYLIHNYFFWCYRNVCDITHFFLWLQLSIRGSCAKLIMYLFIKQPALTKSSVTFKHLLLSATTGNFSNCVLSSSLVFSFNTKHLDSP